MFVTIETNSWGDDEGAYLFDTFQEAFTYLMQQFNPVYEGWEVDKMERYSNINHKLSDADMHYYEERAETDQLSFWCTDSANIWSNGIQISLFKIHNK